MPPGGPMACNEPVKTGMGRRGLRTEAVAKAEAASVCKGQREDKRGIKSTQP